MAYTKQTFVHGQTLTANHLNHIEDGVEQLDTTVTNVVNQVTSVERKVSAVERIVDSLTTDMNDTKATTDNSFSNAIKGSATGHAVTFTDVSPIEHAVLVRVTGVDDPTMVTVTRCGKNILPQNYLDGNSRVHNGITFTVQEDGGIHAVGTATDYAYHKLMHTDISHLPYVLTDCLFNDHNLYTICPVDKGMTVDKVFYPQVEIGDSATEYERPQEHIEYIPTANGEVIDVKSISPTMTLIADTPDAILNVEYNRDATAVINDLLTRVHALENPT